MDLKSKNSSKLIHQAVCQKTYKSKTKLRDHIKRVHGDRVTCNKCQKTFSQRTAWEYTSCMLMKTKHQYVKSVSIALVILTSNCMKSLVKLRRLHIEEWEILLTKQWKPFTVLWINWIIGSKTSSAKSMNTNCIGESGILIHIMFDNFNIIKYEGLIRFKCYPALWLLNWVLQIMPPGQGCAYHTHCQNSYHIYCIGVDTV